MPCADEDCHRPGPYRRGWCATHYARLRRTGSPNPPTAWADVEKRLQAQTTITTAGCWHYDGQPTTRYPQVRIEGQRWSIHVWSYVTYRGRVPAGFQVDHRCRITHCWNPDHLRAIPELDNTSDNLRANAFAAQTHCINGHLFDAENTYWYQNRRICRACKRERRRKK